MVFSRSAILRMVAVEGSPTCRAASSIKPCCAPLRRSSNEDRSPGLGQPGDPGRSGKDNRLFVEAVLWIVRTGSPWRDLPRSFGNWNSVFTRFRDWVRADVWQRLFAAVSDEPDREYAMVDATIVKVHRHGQGAKGGLRARPSAAPKAA